MLHVAPIALISSLGGYKFDGSGLPDGSTGYLSRTYGTAGDRQKYIMRFIWQRTELGSQMLFQADGSGTYDRVEINSSNQVVVEFRQITGLATFSPQLKDVGAWYDLAIEVDTTAQTIKGWLNGVSMPTSSTTTPTLNGNTAFNDTVAHYLFANVAGGGAPYLPDYVALASMQEGQTMTDPVTGGHGNFIIGAQDIGWEISDPTELTYGSEGWLIQGQNVATGTDTSGNSNSFSKTGTIDAVNQAPTDDAPDVGGFAVLNPLDADTVVLSNGNTNANFSSSTSHTVRANLAFDATDTTGFKWEVKVTAGNNRGYIGLGQVDVARSSTPNSATGYITLLPSSGAVNQDGSSVGTFSSVSNGQTVTFRVSDGDLYYDVNGTPANSGSPIVTGLTGLWLPFVNRNSGTGAPTYECDFGQFGFAYSDTEKALATQNLSDGGTITSGTNDANDFVYTGGVCETVTWNSVEYDIDTHDNSVIEFYSNGFIPLSGGTSVSWTATIRLALSVAGVNQVRGQING